MSSSKVVALFDFDGTITHRDSLLPFLLQVFGPVKLAAYFTVLFPTLIGYLLCLIPNGIAKEKVLGRMLTGRDLKALQHDAQQFALKSLPRIVKPESAERIAWHQEQGHRVIIVSASLELYLKPWAASLGIEDVLGTRLKEEEGKVVFGFDGLNCHGEEKAARIKAYLGNLSGLEIYAYGDSGGDTQMLALANHAYYRGELQQE